MPNQTQRDVQATFGCLLAVLVCVAAWTALFKGIGWLVQLAQSRCPTCSPAGLIAFAIAVPFVAFLATGPSRPRRRSTRADAPSPARRSSSTSDSPTHAA